jgi:outer membrane protein assembly factor BamB
VKTATSRLTFYFLLSTFHLLCPSRSSGQSEDWPQFRGPTGQGHSLERGLPAEWSESRNIIWKTAIGGRGWSSPVIAGGRVWITTAMTEGSGASLRALAFDVETGSQVVNVEVFRLRSPNLLNPKNSHASPTPIVEGNRVYVHFGAEGTAAVDADSGTIVWKARFPYGPSTARVARQCSTRIC